MYITQEMLQQVESRYGEPDILRLEQAISPEEMAMVRASQKNGRAHDVTFFIFNPEGRVAVIAKPFFPPGAYRAPSGGLTPGEDFIEGTQREAWEETGLEITVEQYILRVDATFTHGADALAWTSYVVTASTLEPTLSPHDRNEIREAKFMTLEELQGPVRRVLLNTGKGLFRYRCRLTDRAVELIRRLRG
ncbi:MAG: NUDIX hydrolase [Bacillota bacterium]